jgi:plastin-3
MRAYTLSILTQLADTGSPIVEKEIIDWVNNKLAQGKKTTSIRNFQVTKQNNSIEKTP